MQIPNSAEIKSKQNTEDNIRIQCAAGYYFNLAEILNYICWFLCILSAVISFKGDSMVGVIMMFLIDLCCLAVGIIVQRSVECAADLRKLFDARVLFANDGGFAEAEIRRLNEKAICMINRHKKDYEVISVSDGKATPPGKKDWYVFASDMDPLYAQLECQAQNKWWNDKMVSARRWVLCIVAVIIVFLGFLLYRSLSLPIVGLINAVGIILIRLIERIIQYAKYNTISNSIDTMYKSASKQISMDKIEDLQMYIDDRRRLTVFEMNIIHHLFASKLSKLYENILKN